MPFASPKEGLRAQFLLQGAGFGYTALLRSDGSVATNTRQEAAQVYRVEDISCTTPQRYGRPQQV